MIAASSDEAFVDRLARGRTVVLGKLVDADPASNPANWQWVAGSGANAAPYFRIFNPMLQGDKLDADGGHLRRFVPELAKLPNRYLHKPWEDPDKVLLEAGLALGRSYPIRL